LPIDRNAIKHIEDLARIKLNAEEVDTISEQLIRIVGFIEQLQSVDTTDVPPTKLISLGQSGGLREDVVRDGLSRDVVLAQAPDAAGEYFRVPRVIDTGEES